MTLTRTFFTPRAATWEERYAADGARYAAAVSRMGLRPGSEPWTWAAAAAAPYRRCAPRSVTRASCSVWTSPRPCWWPQRGKVEPAWQGCCWPTPAHCRCRPARWTASSAQDWSTMSPPPQRHCASGPECRQGVLLLFHPSGRAERAARHGRPFDSDDPLAEENLRPALGRRAGTWTATRTHPVTSWRAVRVGG